MLSVISYILACLSLFSLPLYVIRFQIGPIPSTLLEVLILLTIISWVVGVVAERINLKTLVIRISSPIMIWGLLLMLAALISVFVAEDKRAALGLWRAYFVEPYVFSVVIVDLVRRGKSAQWLVWSLMGSGVWLSVMGVSQAVFHQPVTADSLHEVQLGRAAAVFNSANALALYLGPLISIAVFQVIKKKFWCLALVAIFLIGIYATKSTGAKLGLGVVEGLVIVGWLWPKLSSSLRGIIWKLLPWLGGIVLVILTVAFLNVSSFTPQVHFTYPRTFTDTRTIRLCLWEGTKQVLLQHPITGPGLSGFKAAYTPDRTCDSELLEYPHNIFLNFWVSTGILGLVAFLVLQLKLWKILKRSEDRLMALGLAAGFGYWVAHGMVDVPYFKNDLAVEFWTLAGLAVLLAENKLKLSKD